VNTSSISAIGSINNFTHSTSINTSSFEQVNDVRNVSEQPYTETFIEKAIGHCLKRGRAVRRSDPFSSYRPKQPQIFVHDITQQDKTTLRVVDNPAGIHADFMRCVVNEKIPRLLAASARNDKCILRALLRQGADVNERDDHGRTALMYAAEFGSVKVLKILLRHGADPLAVCRQNKTALMYAVRHGHSHSVKSLLSIKNSFHRKVLVNAQDNAGLNAVMYAAQGRKADIMQALLQSKPDLSTRAPGYDDKTAVMFATEYGRTEMLEILLDYDKPRASALVSAMDSYGKNVMAYGLASKNPVVVNLLAASGATLTAAAIIDWNQNTLENALQNKNKEFVDLVLTMMKPSELTALCLSGVKVGTDLLMYSVKNTTPSEITSFINSLPPAAIPAVLSVKDANGLTYIHYAIKQRVPKKLFEWLLLKLFPLNSQIHYKKLTPLVNDAIRADNINAVNTLLTYHNNKYRQAILSSRNKYDSTPLRLAVSSASDAMVDYLLDAGAYKYPNMIKTGQSLEMIAANKGTLGILKKLIAYRIEKKSHSLTDIINERDYQGRDIMRYAEMGGNPAVIAFLQEKGAILNDIAR
jgi:ankyrin repeat protein